MRSNFGKYDVPPTLQKLIDLQKDLVDSEQFYLGFNFYLSLDDFRYFNTPCDVVVFGNIGVDGVHYGFLTDFGSASNLEVAPIVCVCPMDFDRPTRVVANNLCEFMKVNLTDGELFYNTFENEDKYLAAKQQWFEEFSNSPYQPNENDKVVRERITKWAKEKIQMPTINNPYLYVQNVNMEREKYVTIQTQDGLGVITPLLEGEKHIPFPVQEYTDLDLKLLREYLTSKPFASRHALIRDIQKNYVLKEQHELQGIIIEALCVMELNDEAKRLAKDN